MYDDEHRRFPPGVGDPFGRKVEVVRREAELAGRAAALLDEALTLGRRLTLGREAGPRLFQRLERSREVFARLAHRDVETADELDAYAAGKLDWHAARRAGTTRLALKPLPPSRQNDATT